MSEEAIQKLRTILQSSGHQENWSRVKVSYDNNMMFMESFVGEYPQYGILLESAEQGVELLEAIIDWLNTLHPEYIRSEYINVAELRKKIEPLIGLLKQAIQNIEGLESLRAVEEKRYRPISLARREVAEVLEELDSLLSKPQEAKKE